MTSRILPAPLPPPPDPASLAALAELVALGTALARTVARLAAVEDHLIDVLTPAAAKSARTLLSSHASLAEATEAGQDADMNSAERAACGQRLAVLAECLAKVTRAVGRTVALQTQLLQRPFREASPHSIAPRPAVPPANDTDAAERPDRAERPEGCDEIAGMSNADVFRAIRRDLHAALPPGAEPAPDAATPPAAPAAAPPALGVSKAVASTAPPPPDGAPRPDT